VLLHEISATPFHLSHQGLNDKDIQITLSRLFASLSPHLLFSSPHLESPQLLTSFTLQQQQQGLRIGFISTHFYQHSIGRILIGVIHRLSELSLHLTHYDSDHDTTRKVEKPVEVFVFSIDRSLPPNTSKEDVLSGNTGTESSRDEGDQITQLLKKALGARYLILPNRLDVIRDVVGHVQLDFLMFTDIGMDLTTYALAFSRLAPYQVC